MVDLRALFIFSLWHGVLVNGSRNESSYIQINNTESDNYTANVSAVIELHNPAGSNKSIDYKTEHTESPVMSNSSLNPHLNNTASHNTTNTSSTQDLHDGSSTTVCPPFETMAEKDLLRVFSSDFVKRLETWKQNVINSCRYCTKRLDLDSENSFKIKLPVLKATVDRDDPFFSFDTIHPALVREKSQHDLVKVAYLSILELWPLLLLCFSCAALSGMVVWLLDSRSNSEQFSKRFWRGIADGMWWAIVTMTTVGYGDKSPKSFFGRLFATVWMVTGIVLLSMFTAQVSSRLTTQELKSEDYLDDKKIGVPAVLFDSDYELNIMMNAIVEVVEYPVKTTTAFTEMDLESLVVFHCEDKSVDDSWELLQFMQPCKVGAEVLMSIVNGQRFIECVNSQIRTQNYRNGTPRAERKNRQSSCRKLLKSQDKLKFEFKWVYFRDLSQYFIPFGTVIGLIIVAFITGTIWDYCCQRKRNKYSRSDTEASQTGFILRGSLKEDESMLEKGC